MYTCTSVWMRCLCMFTRMGNCTGGVPVHVCTHVQVYRRGCLCICVHMCRCIDGGVWACMYTCVCAQVGCLCICVHMCRCIDAGACACMHTCMWRPEVNLGCHLQAQSSLFYWERISHRLNSPTRLAGHQDPGMHLSLFTQCWGLSTWQHTWLLYTGVQTQVFECAISSALLAFSACYSGT